jgi:hypothetical protein
MFPCTVWNTLTASGKSLPGSADTWDMGVRMSPGACSKNMLRWPRCVSIGQGTEPEKSPPPGSVVAGSSSAPDVALRPVAITQNTQIMTNQAHQSIIALDISLGVKQSLCNRLVLVVLPPKICKSGRNLLKHACLLNTTLNNCKTFWFWHLQTFEGQITISSIRT